MEPEVTTFDALDDDATILVRKAFSDLARAQRGRPEAMAVSLRTNPGLFNATGVFTSLAEHVGDLTHRMTEHGGDFTGFGYQTVSEKVARGLRYLRDWEVIERQVETNLGNNHHYRLEDARTTLSLAEFREEFVHAAGRYADAHAELPVWNEAQWHAREAAVALGRLRFDDMEVHLIRIDENLAPGPAHWRAWAGEASMLDGALMPFDGPVPEPGASSAPGL